MARRLRVTNTTRQAVLVEAGGIADNPLTRVRGLLGRRGLEPGDGLLITPCTSIHSMWMRFRFDAVFLSREGEVIHLIEDMAPWRCSPLVWKAQSVLEVPSGTAARTGTRLGDRLETEISP
ncbi:MAG: DUF192 domain-containing protein [Verrucomicrobiota bacterium]